MKTVCLIFSLVVDPSGSWIAVVPTEKPFESIEECQAWKHQQEFHYPVAPVLASQYVCLSYMEV